MRSFHYRDFSWSEGSKVLGGILILGAVIILIAPFLFPVERTTKTLLVAGGALLISIPLLSSFSGVIFDFDKQKYLAYDQWVFVKTGVWKDMPKVNALDMIEHEYTRTNKPNGVSPTITTKGTVYKCVILAEGMDPWTLDYSSQKKATKAMEALTEGLRINQNASLSSTPSDSNY